MFTKSRNLHNKFTQMLSVNFKWVVLACSLAIILSLCSCGAKVIKDVKETVSVDAIPLTINGITFEAPPQVVDSSTFANMKRIEAGWVALVPFGFCRPGSPKVMFNSQRQWWGEKDEGIIGCTQMLQQQKMKTMLKPQIWIGGGTFTGHFDAGDEAGWQSWESGYSDYILHNAKLADSLGIELFCIGTELENAVAKRPAFWGSLIDSVRKIYKGKLTYAANWNEYEKFPYWKKLDYIGIDAYFPLSDAEEPGVEELVKGWDKAFTAIKNFQSVQKIPVLFTEYGYRSVNNCAKEPWVADRKGTVNLNVQQNAYEALYRRFAPENWFAGGFIWKWHARDERAGGENNNDFTPQHKPVETVIKKWHTQKK
jgi:GTA TIM-barrel-like domain